MKVPTAIIIKLMPKMNKFATNSYIYIRKHNHNITTTARKIIVILILASNYNKCYTCYVMTLNNQISEGNKMKRTIHSALKRNGKSKEYKVQNNSYIRFVMPDGSDVELYVSKCGTRSSIDINMWNKEQHEEKLRQHDATSAIANTCSKRYKSENGRLVDFTVEQTIFTRK